MSFNFDNEINRISRLPQQAQGWLREIFLKDWGLKLIALSVALILWFGVTGQRTPTTKSLNGIKLSFNLPPNTDIGNDYRNGIDVKISGDKSDIARLDERSLVATVDISDYQAGERLVQLTTKNVFLDLPTGVKLEGITPNSVSIRIEAHVEKELEVEPLLVGKPAEGYEVIGKPEAVPAKIKVSGPENHVKLLEKAFTAKIPVDGLNSDFTETKVAIDIKDDKIFIADSVSVKIKIGEKRVEKSFNNVAVHVNSGGHARPETASVTLFGAKSILEKMRSDEISIVLDLAADGSITPRLILPETIPQGTVELRSTKPSGFSIEK